MITSLGRIRRTEPLRRGISSVSIVVTISILLTAVFGVNEFRRVLLDETSSLPWDSQVESEATLRIVEDGHENSTEDAST